MSSIAELLTELPKSKVVKETEKPKGPKRVDYGPTSAGDVALSRFMAMSDPEGQRHDRALQKIGAKGGTGGP